MNHTATQSSRVVAVTGAGTGIGRATARAFAAEGAHVVAIGRRPGPREATAAGHDRVTPPAADITGGGEPERIVEDVLDTHGRLDVLVNNAGIVRGGALGTLTPEVTGAQPATNLIPRSCWPRPRCHRWCGPRGDRQRQYVGGATRLARQLGLRGLEDGPGAADPQLGGGAGAPRDTGGGGRPRCLDHRPDRGPRPARRGARERTGDRGSPMG